MRASRCRSGGWRAKGHAPRRRAEARLYFDATLLTLVELPALCAWLGKAFGDSEQPARRCGQQVAQARGGDRVST
ncbi:hypothetical protein [Rhodomicrobium lacus]|uniref:hypothetical protein n=1 Tax=Rhodomicrobium lacus TaxID=2498452 RepID=UPI0026E323B4|nr:hypothetical protein [Rhodomicrobium lacus]WKW49434.1 hypothetical protein QMO75_08960 [Rhodomicrobium lacus]